MLGSREFVNEVFVQHREKFGPRRQNGARRIRGVPLLDIRVLRDLRVRAVGIQWNARDRNRLCVSNGAHGPALSTAPATSSPRPHHVLRDGNSIASEHLCVAAFNPPASRSIRCSESPGMNSIRWTPSRAAGALRSVRPGGNGLPIDLVDDQKPDVLIADIDRSGRMLLSITRPGRAADGCSFW